MLGQIAPSEGAIFRGKEHARPCRRTLSCAKTAEAIEMLFGLRAWVATRNHILDGGTDPYAKEHFLGERACSS